VLGLGNKVDRLAWQHPVGHGEQKEITEFPDTIIGRQHHEKSPVPRYYFLDENERESARKAMQGS